MAEKQAKPVQLLMHRANLNHLPVLELPPGYTLRDFTDADEPAWNALQDLAYGCKPGHNDFTKLMRSDPEFRPERVKLIVCGGAAVATASAWHRPVFGAHVGYVHWVGSHPEHRGKKLGHWVTVAAMELMRGEGRTQVVLHTDDFRLAAIKVYLALGFVPVLDDESHRTRWPAILEQLGAAERFESILSGPRVTLPLRAN